MVVVVVVVVVFFITVVIATAVEVVVVVVHGSSGHNSRGRLLFSLIIRAHVPVYYLYYECTHVPGYVRVGE